MGWAPDLFPIGYMDVDIPEEDLDNDNAAAEEMETDEEAAISSEGNYFKKYENCPGHWDPMDEREVNKKEGSPEYYDVVLPFFKSMVDRSESVEVTRVYRVQNPIKWKYYTVKKEEMILDSEGSGKALEEYLFHGTSSDALDAICRKGLDPRINGKHGTTYGKGSYFAKNASYSHHYTDRRKKINPNLVHPGQPGPSSGMQTVKDKFKARMLFAKVLVGSYTIGNPQLRKPPARNADDPFGKCYDSCVDNIQDPKIFVIFDTTQAYPEYLIEYSYS
ncbi:protein mono-ADP-ribosyltransferase PARP11-like [Dreissena polymorpha]|uniref:protein mono-ADP-ribosyltransferase PARP11-like n=1 Tax=Dreissena polymorpha TaxID=45954 RepID=UPI00226477B2|nr:protein mono-ADP-ribosyltransferase PARP11-like [Dreissena polymorpha]